MKLKCWTIKNYGECFICIKTYLDEEEENVFGLIDSQFGDVGVPSRLNLSAYKINEDIIDIQTIGRETSIREVELTKHISIVAKVNVDNDDKINEIRDSIINPLKKSFDELKGRFDYTEKEFNFSTTADSIDFE